jgi:membrane-associated protease RseP (regulator of RpoE activity)
LFWAAPTPRAAGSVAPGHLAFWLDVFLSGLPYAFWVTLILGTHEMGHYLACRHYRIPATLPFFIPAPPVLVGSFGALIRIRGVIPHRRALFDVAAAGPLAGFAVALPVMLVGVMRAEPVVDLEVPGSVWLGSPLLLDLVEWVAPSRSSIQVNQLIGAGWVGMLVTSLNLFPVGQLDGGHAAYAISRRLHRLLAYGTLVALLGLMVYQALVLEQVPAYTVWFLILLWMRDRHPRLMDEHGSLGTGRRVVALVLLLIFLLAFIPVPLTVIDG